MNDDPDDGVPRDPGPEVAAHDPRRLQEIQALQRAIDRGFQVEAFLRDDIGQYFRLRASRELEEAQEALVEADASNTHFIRNLQLKAQVAQRVLTWFAEAVAEGENAEAQFQQQFDEAREG